ncbi:MAG: hypothetical protein IJ187_07950 [Neisseriaceae bacterium]|nr:hypothetical protein [Neisseriaceae bacterium]
MVNKRIEFVAIFLQTAYFTTEWGRLDRLSGSLKAFPMQGKKHHTKNYCHYEPLHSNGVVISLL